MMRLHSLPKDPVISQLCGDGMTSKLLGWPPMLMSLAPTEHKGQVGMYATLLLGWNEMISFMIIHS